MKLLSTAQVAAMFGVNERHVRWLIKHRRIESERIGRAHLVVAESLKNWAKHPTKGRPKSKPEKPLRKSRKKSGKTPNVPLT
jgi:excisionase family DNA binding protein